jgi:NAD-dependent deacetylase
MNLASGDLETRKLKTISRVNLMARQSHPPGPEIPAELIRLLATAQRLVVLTGAGISVESGIPTFRGPEGLWRSFRPEELATPRAFERDPRLVWEWYDWRRQKIAPARPNPGHEALVGSVKPIV